MGILSQVSDVLQSVFGTDAEEAAAETEVIQRKRRFNAVTLAKTFVLTFLQKPDADDNDMAVMGAAVGVEVSPQAISQRYTERARDFFEKLFQRVTRHVVASEKALAPILERFTRVLILDSSTITLPESQEDRFRGCGGSHGSGKSALKLQTELDLRTGALHAVEIEEGRSPDGASGRQQATHEAGTLRITDLGYFNLKVFQCIAAASAYFLSRLQHGTKVFVEGEAIPNLLVWLNAQASTVIDCQVELGVKYRLPCRLIAWRLPPEQAARRKQKMRETMRRKHGREPSKDGLALCEWTILVTNVPVAMMTVKEAIVLYRARWQVELLFKRWKSIGLVADLTGKNDVQIMTRLWARLIAATIQHWLTVAVAWPKLVQQSLHQTASALQDFALQIAASLSSPQRLQEVLELIVRTTARTCRRNKRSKPGTFELLADPEKLDFV